MEWICAFGALHGNALAVVAARFLSPDIGYRCLRVAAHENYAHIPAELPVVRDEVKVVIGDVKRRASGAVK